MTLLGIAVDWYLQDLYVAVTLTESRVSSVGTLVLHSWTNSELTVVPISGVAHPSKPNVDKLLQKLLGLQHLGRMYRRKGGHILYCSKYLKCRIFKVHVIMLGDSVKDPLMRS